MKNYTLLLCALAIVSFTFSSCNTYHSIHNAKNVSQLSANPFVKKVARSVMRNISTNVISKGLTSFKGKPLLRSSLSTLLNTSQSVSAFKGMLSNKYGISESKVDANYKNMSNVRDVINFVARNGKQFDFNSYSNKLF